jgi:WD40 repeat protein
LPDTKPISSRAGWASDPAIAVTSDGRHLYYLGERWLIRGWDLELNRELPPIELERDTLVTGLAIAPDGVMAISTWDGSVRLLALDSRQWLAKFQEHLSWVSGLKFCKDGSLLISASADQTCAIYDRNAQSTRRLRGHTTEIWAMDISADGNSLVTGASYGGTIIRWLLDSASSAAADDVGVAVVLRSTDGRLLRYRRGATDYERYDLASGRVEPAGMSRLGPLVRHPGSPSDAAAAGGEWHRVSPDTRWVLTGPGDKPFAWLWNAHSGEKERMLTNQWGRVTWGLMSDDGAYVVLAGINSEVRLYRTADWTSEVLVERSGNEDARKAVKAFFSRDSKRLAIDGVGEGVVVVDLGSKSVVNRFATPTGFLAVAFSHGARYLAYGGSDNLIRIFDLQRAEALPPLTGHAAGVWGLAFAPDDRTLASAGDKRIKLWNVESRQEIFTLHLGDRNPTRLSFSSDGRHLVSHDPYQVWTAPSWEVIAATEAREKTETKQP